MPTEDCTVGAGRLISAKETAGYMGIGTRLLWKFTVTKDAAKKIPSYKIGKRRLYKVAEIEYWIENHREG